MKQSADDNFKFDENTRKFSKWVEDTLGKGEIACHEQFLLFPQCLQKVCFPGASKDVIVWEWVNKMAKFIDMSKLKAFSDNKLNVVQKLKFVFGKIENMVEKGDNIGYQHFSFSYNVFIRLLCWVDKSLDCMLYFCKIIG